MKANRSIKAAGDEAVSPVIAVILMVAITVVLAATVYLFVSGFGNQQQSIVTASYAAKSVDLPSGDTDTTDDAIELTYTSGTGDLSVSDVTLYVDGQALTWDSTNGIFTQGGTFAAGDLCANAPAGSTTTWARGAFLYVRDTHATTGTAADCGATPTVARLADLDGVHQIKVVVRGQVVLDTSIEVHDNGAA